MPLFEYRCAGCGTPFEKLVSSEQSVACPSCGSENVQKQLSTFAFSTTAATAVPDCSSSGCGYDRGGCGSGMCGGGGSVHHHD